MIKFKKNKKIFFGIVSCALVSLASVGFSSWIISIEQPNQNFSVSINVDTMSFETVICEAKLDKSNKTITLGPSKVSDSGIVGGDKVEEDLSTPIKGQVIIANEEKQNIDSVKISVVSNSDGSTVDNNKPEISVTSGQTDIFGRNAGGDYYYLKPSISSIAIDNLTFSKYSVEGFQVAELDTLLSDLEITYSSYFGNEDPATFYSNKLEAIKQDYVKGTVTSEYYLGAIKKAQDEITEMNKNLNSLTIKIEVTKVGANQ